MKKFLKVLAVLSAIGAAIAAVLLYFKKCEAEFDSDFDDEDEDSEAYDKREYVSIQPLDEEEAPAEEEAPVEE